MMRGLYVEGFKCMKRLECPYCMPKSDICDKVSAEYRFEHCGKYYEFSENTLLEGARQFNGGHKTNGITRSPEPL